jgi:hypothetical protein
MLTLTGTVLNVLETPKGQRQDGTSYGGYHQVQMQVEETLKNDEKRISLHNLTTDNPEAFKARIGESVSVQVAAWAAGRNDLRLQLIEGAIPVLEKAQKRAS